MTSRLIILILRGPGQHIAGHLVAPAKECYLCMRNRMFCRMPVVRNAARFCTLGEEQHHVTTSFLLWFWLEASLTRLCFSLQIHLKLFEGLLLPQSFIALLQASVQRGPNRCQAHVDANHGQKGQAQSSI